MLAIRTVRWSRGPLRVGDRVRYVHAGFDMPDDELGVLLIGPSMQDRASPRRP